MTNALYIHIPFCKSICSYCDFPKMVSKEENQIKYVDALIKELWFYKDYYINIETIYIGGGTPSSLSINNLTKLFENLHKVLNFNKVMEFSIECNPNDITNELSILFKKYKINRVSIGCQTFNDSLLKILNRTHNKQDIITGIKLLKQQGITNINIDLMFAIPTQTIDLVKNDIKEVLALDVTHISYYSLILEDNTLLSYNVSKNLIKLLDEEIEGIMYEHIIESLTDNGFNHYEISNFSKENYQSQHNLTYWLNKEYVGIGLGAHGYLDKSRYYNVSSLNQYIDLINDDPSIVASTYEVEPIKEEFLFGLRLINGISIKDIEKKYSINVFDSFPKIKEFLENGFLILEQDNIKFSKKGLLLGNFVFEIFV